MAKPKGKDIVGWTNIASAGRDIDIVAEKDVDQRARHKVGTPETWSSGHIVRQLGLARHWRNGTTKPPTFYLYTHSQVSNGNPRLYQPPVYVGLSREDLEWCVAVFLRELYGDKPAAE